MERGGGVGGENMCEDLRPGSGNTGMCIPSARSSVTFLTSVLTGNWLLTASLSVSNCNR